MDANPTIPVYQSDLAYSLLSLGTLQRRAAHPGAAAAAFRQAALTLERYPTPTPIDRYDLACCYALLAGVAADAGSGMTTAEGQAAADQAMTALREAVAAGYRNSAHMRRDTDLEALRPRDDFQKLLKELDAKATPADRPKDDTPPKPEKK